MLRRLYEAVLRRRPDSSESPADAGDHPPTVHQARFSLDDDLLRELGLGEISTVEKNLVLALMYESLEVRVGKVFASSMTDDQLEEFEGFIDAEDEGGALAWLEAEFPDYGSVVGAVLLDLKGEIRMVVSLMLEEISRSPIRAQGI